MNACGITDAGKVRSQNQDAYYLGVWHEDKQAILVVCDGMGGARAGHVASQTARACFVEEVTRALKPSMTVFEMKQALAHAAREANTCVFNKACGNEEYIGMGTTLVGALLSHNMAAVVNVGDSRAYRIGEFGIARVTRDHSLVEALIDKGEITFEEARSHPSKNLITRALGTEETVDCDIYTFEMQDGEYLLLCSDGLTNVVEDQEILYEVLYGGDSSQCCRQLLDLANKRGGPDNITVAVAQL